MYLILTLLVFLLSTAHCDQIPNDDVSYVTQNVITDTNALIKYDTETTSDPFYTPTSGILLSENDKTVSQPIGSARTSPAMRNIR